ncbi:MAG: DUF1365 domain-containing protein [Burkholderiales bacterium]|nr:DUF1365 domain-containing protein [Burkholderiales bacterium]
MMKPSIVFGEVMHRRLRPAEHRFVYPVYFLRLPLSELSRGRRTYGGLFSVNRWNLLSLRHADHGDGGDPLAWIRGLLAREGIHAADGEVVLQTFPRVLGYVFNPVSFWFCHDRAGALRAVLAVVNNTFGERHSYLLARADQLPIAEGELLEARKVLHVSPFCPVRGGYRFRFLQPEGRALARIDYADEQGDLLHTSVSGRAELLSAATLARAFFGYPLMTLGIILRIHYQALRLWVKRVPFFTKPEPPLKEVTR